jgi:acetolactate synthase-1/2/3 large subunit
MSTVGEALIGLLEAFMASTPCLAFPASTRSSFIAVLPHRRIRHITPRHEQGAAFMADGYARASGKPGVAFVITGPGLTNAITAMAQARADSVPDAGHFRRQPPGDAGQGAWLSARTARPARPDAEGRCVVFRMSRRRINWRARCVMPSTVFEESRPGPVHIEIPLEVMGLPADNVVPLPRDRSTPELDFETVKRAADFLRHAQNPIILAGGGARTCNSELATLAEKLGALVVTTVNGRGLLHRHPLGVPASPSLKSVRRYITQADAVLAVGTEFGPTDYDMYGDGGSAIPKRLVRIDIDAAQLDRHPADIKIQADSGVALAALLELLSSSGVRAHRGADRAAAARAEAWSEIGSGYAGTGSRGRDDPRRATRRFHRRRFDPAGLCRKPLL